MEFNIKRATVIGAGTMGAGIAALLANAGILVYLLDVIPNELNEREKEKGWTLEHQAVRNRIVSIGMKKLTNAKNPVFFHPVFSKRVQTGNLEDNFDWVGQSDWIIEAIVENRDIKKKLYKRIEKVRKPDSIISTNTSGLLLSELSSELSNNFGEHFIGTHFFNPPTIMRLVEIIPGPLTDPKLTKYMISFCENVLGKGVILCKDTPNFIANRLGGFQATFDQNFSIENQYTVEEADAILGTLIGRPKTALFRLRDLIGLDTSDKVLRNLYHAIPKDKYREILFAPQITHVRQTMIERGWLGAKSGQGFYKKVQEGGKTIFRVLDLEKFEYRDPQKILFPGLEEVAKIKHLGERLRFLVDLNDRVGHLVWGSIKNILSYAAYCAPDISDNYLNLDKAMRWGYSWELGPFEIWDALGPKKVIERMESEGLEVANWVKDFITSDDQKFYKNNFGKTQYFDFRSKEVIQRSTENSSLLNITNYLDDSKNLIKIPGASMHDIGDGIARVNFIHQINLFDDIFHETLSSVLQEVERNFIGLIISNSETGPSNKLFLSWLLEKSRAGNFEEIDKIVKRAQQLHTTMRFFQKPIVTMVSGISHKFGADISVSSTHVCAQSNSQIGFFEFQIGLFPYVGGCKELLRRVVFPIISSQSAEPMTNLKQIFNTLANRKVSYSAYDAIEKGFLNPSDYIVMNPDHLLIQTKNMVQFLEKSGYRPPAQEKNIYALGKRGISVLEHEIYLQKESGKIQDFDGLVKRKLAYTLCGGELTSPQWVNEEYILDLERDALCSLSGESEIQSRIEKVLSA